VRAKYPLIQWQEWRVVILYTLFLLFLTSLPYYVAWHSEGDAWVFSGHLFGVEDGNSYTGKMRLGARGHWDFYLFYTSENHDDESLFYLPYIISGQVVGLFLTPDDPRLFRGLLIGFQALRIIADVVLVIALYLFIAQFLQLAKLRLLALILSTMGSGLGWLIVALSGGEWLGTLPPDFFIPEGFSFLILLGLPHIALARAALFVGFLCMFQSLKSSKWLLWSIGAGVCWILVGLGVSFYLAILYCLMVIWGSIVWLHQRHFPLQLTLRGTVPILMTLPLFLYYVWVFNTNEVFAQWSTQNQLPSPHPLQYIVVYAIWYILSITATIWLWHKKHLSEPELLLIGWIIAMPILVYLPINVQRRMAEGVIVPLSILSVIGLRLLLPILSRYSYRRTWTRWRAALLFSLLLSTGILWLSVTLAAKNPQEPVFRSKDEIIALDWLNTHAEANAVVLALMPTANVVPAHTNLRVFVGHGPETVHSTQKKRLAQAFFADTLTPVQQQDLLVKYGIQYVFAGPQEQQLSTSKRWASSLTLIYNRGNYQIYEVK